MSQTQEQLITKINDYLEEFTNLDVKIVKLTNFPYYCCEIPRK